MYTQIIRTGTKHIAITVGKETCVKCVANALQHGCNMVSCRYLHYTGP